MNSENVTPASSWMGPEATALYEEAEALAEQRGCVIENDCWVECMDAALAEVEQRNRAVPEQAGDTPSGRSVHDS